MAGLYEWIDQNIAQGLLPGGVEVGRGLIPSVVAGGVTGALAPLGFGAPAGAAPGAPLFPGVPGVAPGAAPVRGRLMTAVARVLPNGQVQPVSMAPGRPALMQSDYTAAKRVKRIQKKVNRLFPLKRRTSKKK